MKLGMKIAVVFVLVLLIVGIVGVQSYLGIERVTETNRWVVHTHEVMEKLEHVLSVLKDAETGQRGFVLTGENRYLEPYNAASAEIEKDIDDAASLTKDNPEQQQALKELRNLSRGKLDELRETIELRRNAGMGAALKVIRSDRGKRIMDEIRGLLDRMESRESGLLEQRTRAAGTAARQSTMMLGFGVLLSLVVLGVAAVIVTRTMQLADRGPLSGAPGSNWRKTAIQYAFAVAGVGLAMAVKSWLESFGPMPVFIVFYPMVLLVASIAGGGPAILFTVLAVLAAEYWYFPPSGSFAIQSSGDALALGIFGGSSMLLSVLAERLQHARRAEAVSVTQKKELALLNMGNLMTLDLDHRIVHWSEGNHRLYGFGEQETMGRLTYELLQTQFTEPLDRIHGELMEKNYWEGEATRRSKDGTHLSVSLLWALRRDEHGNPLDILEVSTDMTRQKFAEEALRQQSEELAQQNEELSQQSEELTQQSEELSEQNEELQTQSEEIQALNGDLVRREKMLQMLLDSARLPLGEEEVIGEICRAAMDMTGQPTGVVVCEQQGEELGILAHAGFAGAAVPASWPLKDSFISLVMSEDRTASLEDTALRPDLNILDVPGYKRFGAVLSSPVRVKGKPIGAVSVYTGTTRQWTAEQFRMIEWVAAQCSHTLEAMRLTAEVIHGRKQSEFLANILEASSQAFGVGYPDGHLGLINKAFERLTGYSTGELRSMDWQNTLTPPEWLEMELRKLDELNRTGQPVRYEKEYIRKDGTRVPIELLVQVVKNAAGEPLYYYSFIADITERRRAEEALSENRAKLEAALASMTDAVFISDSEGKFINFNDAFATFHRFRNKDECAKTFAEYPDILDVFMADGTLAPVDMWAVPRALRGEIATNAEYTLRRKDTGESWVGSYSFAPIRDENGTIVGSVVVGRDITEHKKAEEDLIKLSEDLGARNLELESANKEMESFVYSISHDLRAPIRTMAGFAKIVNEDYAGKLDTQGLDYLARILRGSAKATELIDDLLHLSRISRQDIDRIEVNLSHKASKVVEELREMNGGRKVDVVVQEGLKALVDPRLIELALSNLLGNAWKFTSKTDNARIEFASTRQDGKTVYYVRDNGVGFDASYAEKMFLPFHRLHSESEFEGTGIGLTIVERVVRRHGGQICAEGEVGKGATVYFTLG
jgi:PAS domain S-box-containing protein